MKNVVSFNATTLSVSDMAEAVPGTNKLQAHPHELLTRRGSLGLRQERGEAPLMPTAPTHTTLYRNPPGRGQAIRGGLITSNSHPRANGRQGAKKEVIAGHLKELSDEACTSTGRFQRRLT